MDEGSIRSFIAVPVPEDVRAALGQAAGDAFSGLPHVRAVPPGGIHATLKFMGNIDARNVAKIGELLKRIARNHKPFALRVEGVGGFPNLDNPRVLFADMKGETDRLVALASEIDLMAATFGCAPEPRPYSPHLTLARVKAPKQLGLLRKRLRPLENRFFGELPVGEIVLYRSDLTPTGARYTPLAGAKLS